MSITIKLDAPALKSLIDADPEFKLELQRSVVAEVTRNTLLKDVAGLIKQVLPVVAESVLQSMRDDELLKAKLEAAMRGLVKPISWNSAAKLTPETQALLDEHVKSILHQGLRTAGARAEDVFAKLEERLNKYVDDKLPSVVTDAVDHATGRKVNQLVADRLNAVLAAVTS